MNIILDFILVYDIYNNVHDILNLFYKKLKLLSSGTDFHRKISARLNRLQTNENFEIAQSVTKMWTYNQYSI